MQGAGVDSFPLRGRKSTSRGKRVPCGPQRKMNRRLVRSWGVRFTAKEDMEVRNSDKTNFEIVYIHTLLIIYRKYIANYDAQAGLTFAWVRGALT